jgi:DMSO/TMAO reductase YedYZ molybdopterin-dependent catalytic subunit
MPRWSRRTLVQAVGVAALSAVAGPLAAGAGFLDKLFGLRDRKPTPPLTPNEEFYLTSYRSPPSVRVPEWSLSIVGLVARPMTLDYEQLLAKPAVSHVVTLECVGNTVGGEFISTAEWRGVPLRSLLEEAGVSPDAYDLVFRAADGYSDSITLDRAMAGDVMVAYRMNGVSLPQSHGFPARVIVPGHYGMKSVQWLTEIEAVDHDYKGYYAKKGWTDDAVIKTTSRIDLPEHGAIMTGPAHRIEGLAFAGIRGITRVEISTDGGEQWSAVALKPALSTASWVFWTYEWTLSKPGRYTIVVRATDGTGKLQTSIEQDAAPDGATGLHEITVTVEL